MTGLAFQRPEPPAAIVTVDEEENALLRRILLAILAQRPDQELELPRCMVEDSRGFQLRTRVEGKTLILSAERTRNV